MRNWRALERSKSLRIDMTPPERRLRYRLNRRQLDGIKFRRQASIGPYIADFLSHDAMIIIELDEHRTEFLEAKGFRIIRFFIPKLARISTTSCAAFALRAV